MLRDREQRVFWLGMHIVLTKTELPRLRQLGYEVFNPPYLSDIYDQSANMEWDHEQPTTLPPEVFRELSEYNFFYHPITGRVAQYLNEYFGTVIVTINPDWLHEVMRVYTGRIIYRTYGQTGNLSEYLWKAGWWRGVVDRKNFWFVPHAAEVARHEAPWLKDRMEVVPYTIPLDTFDHRDTWNIDEPHEPEIMVSCPNIKNSYFAGHYRYLNLMFPFDYLRLYGVQPEPVDDPRIVGTIPRAELLERYRRSAGYFYTYRVPNVCYLPPIEMMTLGGPVVFLPGSLLAAYFPKDSPGLAHDAIQARRLLCRLIDGDRGYIQEVIASQREVRLRYAPEHANPIFDEVFPRLISGPPAPSPITRVPPERLMQRKRVYLLFHFPNCLVHSHEGEYYAFEGIPRVMRKLAQMILEQTDYDLVITCKAAHFEQVFGFFRSLEQSERLSFLRVDEIPDAEKAPLPPPSLYHRVSVAIEGYAFPNKPHGFVSDNLRRAVRCLAYRPIRKVRYLANEAVNQLKRIGKRQPLASDVAPKPRYIEAINTDPNAACVVIPHYYLFPEAKQLNAPTMLYLPDYLPHFVKEPFEGNAEPNVRTGKELVERATVVLTNSAFTRSYLPECTLQVPSEKIHVVPLPLLTTKHRPIDSQREAKLRMQIGDSPFLFYPTQNRPNKQLAFLLKMFAVLRLERPNLKLVLTCSLDPVPEVAEVYLDCDLSSSVVLLPAISDSELAWLYQHAAALCLTSTMEGNFPPQVFEALTAGTPVVATRLPMITEILDDESDYLLLCEPLDEVDFLQKVLFALDHPDAVRERQQLALELVLRHASDVRFQEATTAVLRTLAALEEPYRHEEWDEATFEVMKV